MIEPERGDSQPLPWRRIGAFHIVVVLLFVGAVGHFYDGETGFTSLIGFGDRFEARRSPALRSVARYVERRSAGYDGQFYAEIAMDPLLADPATDRTLDAAPLRARRVLFSWTAHWIGLGRPSGVLQAYALQNVVSWLVLALVLLRWFPPDSIRATALWFASLWNVGLIWSVRYALLDGPSLLVLSLAVACIEIERRAIGAVLLGIAGLGRETNLLGAPAVVDPSGRSLRGWLRQAGHIALVGLPFLVWFDYIYSIYRTQVFTTGDTLVGPLAGYSWLVGVAVRSVAGYSLTVSTVFGVFAIVSVTVQAMTVVLTRSRSNPWWRLGCGYIALLVLLGRPLLEGTPGTFLRVLLPLALAFNVLLPRDSRWFWPLAVAGNLTVIQGLFMLCAPALARYL